MLNYLRDGDCILPTGKQEQQELRKEAEFYQLSCRLSATLPDAVTWLHAIEMCHFITCLQCDETQTDLCAMWACGMAATSCQNPLNHHLLIGHRMCNEHKP